MTQKRACTRASLRGGRRKTESQSEEWAASGRAESASRGAISLKCLLQGARWKLSQCPPTTHGHSSEPQTAQELGREAMSAFFPVLIVGEGEHLLGGHLSGLPHIQNVSYRLHFSKAQDLQKYPRKRIGDTDGQVIRPSIWAKLGSDKIHPKYTFIKV